MSKKIEITLLGDDDLTKMDMVRVTVDDLDDPKEWCVWEVTPEHLVEALEMWREHNRIESEKWREHNRIESEKAYRDRLLAQERRTTVREQRKHDKYASPGCPNGWLCPDSPTGVCSYDNGDLDQCDHCGYPEERR